MKYLLLLLLTSCTIFYNVEYKYELTTEEYKICKEIYKETINLDNIYIADIKDKEVYGYYFRLEDKILLRRESLERDTLRLMTIIHELCHRYQYKYYGKASEPEAYNIEAYVIFLTNENYISQLGQDKEDFIVWLRDYIK